MAPGSPVTTISHFCLASLKVNLQQSNATEHGTVPNHAPAEHCHHPPAGRTIGSAGAGDAVSPLHNARRRSSRAHHTAAACSNQQQAQCWTAGQCPCHVVRPRAVPCMQRHTHSRAAHQHRGAMASTSAAPQQQLAAENVRGNRMNSGKMVHVDQWHTVRSCALPAAANEQVRDVCPLQIVQQSAAQWPAPGKPMQ